MNPNKFRSPMCHPRKVPESHTDRNMILSVKSVLIRVPLARRFEASYVGIMSIKQDCAVRRE
jgi:hypothetical protein